MCFSNSYTSLANDNQSDLSQKILSRINGDWYNDKDELVLSIQENYINGCEVFKAISPSGGLSIGKCIFRIIENNGYRDITLFWRVFNDQHDYILYNNSLLHKQSFGYYESVGGIHLGMNIQNVINNLGNPSKSSQQTSATTLYYEPKGLELYFTNNMLSTITINRGGTAHFDKTGFNCNDKLEDYYTEYDLSTPISKGFRKIKNTGEYLHFIQYPEKVSLSIFPY